MLNKHLGTINKYINWGILISTIMIIIGYYSQAKLMGTDAKIWAVLADLGTAIIILPFLIIIKLIFLIYSMKPKKN